jgi:hypothetical protein
VVDAYLITEYQDIASLAAIKPSAQENSKSKSKKCNTVKST